MTRRLPDSAKRLQDELARLTHDLDNLGLPLDCVEAMRRRFIRLHDSGPLGLVDALTIAARVLMPGGTYYIWGGYANIANYPPALKASGMYFSQAIVWVKGHPVLTRKDMMGNHEWAFYGWRTGAGHRWFGPNNATDTWEVKKVPSQSMVHLTEKPVELATRALQYSSQAGENVLDLFTSSAARGPRSSGASRPDAMPS